MDLRPFEEFFNILSMVNTPFFEESIDILGPLVIPDFFSFVVTPYVEPLFHLPLSLPQVPKSEVLPFKTSAPSPSTICVGCWVVLTLAIKGHTMLNNFWPVLCRVTSWPGELKSNASDDLKQEAKDWTANNYKGMGLLL